MGKLRQKMEQELRLRNYKPTTIKSYVSAVRQLAAYHRIPPDEMDIEHIRSFLLYKVETLGCSTSTHNIAIAAFQFFFRHVCPREDLASELPKKRRPKRRKLPVVLNEAETVRLIRVAGSLRNQAILMTLYATGLRINELRNLKIEDIDSEAMTIHVREGKGGKERYVMLSRNLLEILRSYWKEYRPKNLVFPGRDPASPLGQRTIQKIFRQAKKRAGIKKSASPHSLRHTFATRLLENGANIRYIQELLGHSSIQTTMIYTKVTRDGARQISSPLDFLPL